MRPLILASLSLTIACFSSDPSIPEPVEHRAEPEVCDMFRSPTEPAPTEGECMADADCTDGDNGRCQFGRGGGFCSYDGCFEDSDCPSGPCVCGGDVAGNFCARGDCRVDADCGEDGFCSPTFGSCGAFFGVEAYYCHTVEDECIDDVDCSAEGAGAYCAFSTELGHWACSTSMCAG